MEVLPTLLSASKADAAGHLWDRKDGGQQREGGGPPSVACKRDWITVEPLGHFYQKTHSLL